VENQFPILVIRGEREHPILRKHPWIFSGSIQRVVGDPAPGETVKVTGEKGDFLAWASYSPASQIRARIMSWTESEKIGPALFKDRLKASLAARDSVRIGSDAMRLVHGESDGMPGLIVDRYRDVLVLQILSAGMERWQEEILTLLDELETPTTIYERSDVEVRSLEGYQPRSGLRRGEPPPEFIPIHEGEVQFNVDVRKGHKTGFYLDQRANRALFQTRVENCDVLDCFSYTGGFSLHALQGKARSVTMIDSSQQALNQARTHIKQNGFPEDKVNFINGNVFEELRTLRDKAQSFDVIVLDPPKFAPTASHASQAARGYKDINLWAFKLLKPGGSLFTFSCSGGIDRKAFQKYIADAALDAGVHATIRQHLWQDVDHPVGLNFPEGSYLKGFNIRVVGKGG